MVKITVAISLISKSHDQRCKGIQLVQADDQNTLSEMLEVVRTHLQLPAENVYLLYRGCDVVQGLAQTTLKDCCSASLTVPRFSAVYTTPSRPEAGGSEGLQLFVKTLAGRVFDFMLCFGAVSILDLKRMVRAKSGIPIEQQRLMFAGKRLEDDKLASDYNLQKESTLREVTIVSSPKLAVRSVNVSNHGSVQQLAVPQRKFSIFYGIRYPSDVSLCTAPDWRNCCRGANIEGRCANTFCCAYQRTVIVPVRDMGVLPLSYLQDIADCPSCGLRFEPQAYSFTNCVWAYDSRQFGSNWQIQDVCSNWQYVPCYKYQRFHKAAADMADWHMLTFLVKPSPDTQAEETYTCICPICHEFPPAQSAVTTVCGHSFHCSCLDAWKRFLPAATCPVCKGSLEVKKADLVDLKHTTQTSPRAPARVTPTVDAASTADTLSPMRKLPATSPSSNIPPALPDAKLQEVTPANALSSVEPVWLDPSKWPSLGESNQPSS